MIIVLEPNFTSTLIGVFFSVIVKTDCETDGSCAALLLTRSVSVVPADGRVKYEELWMDSPDIGQGSVTCCVRGPGGGMAKARWGLGSRPQSLVRTVCVSLQSAADPRQLVVSPPGPGRHIKNALGSSPRHESLI